MIVPSHYLIGLRCPRQTIRSCSTPLILRYSTSTTDRLDFAAIDTKWQARWDARRKGPSNGDILDAGTPKKKKAFVMPMFPYPSGTLHLGHLRVYTISDVIARYNRMRGYDVIHPMGWDAFGLPAENAAMERGIDPAQWTLDNIAKMKEQLKAMGAHFDWEKELMTCDPTFYKHTQKIFLMLHERGLAYRAESLVNYDPVDGTVLANEQVDSNGCSWRSGAKVERIRLRQWFLGIKAFQESLLEDLETLSQDGKWPERVLTQQKNWIGKSDGANISFQLHVQGQDTAKVPIEVFTTRLDTLFGVQYLALSLNHPLVLQESEKSSELRAFVEAARDLPPDSKAGFQITTLYGVNPASVFKGPLQSATSRHLPVFVAPYVLEDYGSGAVMGVPGHDNRDFAFWQANKGDEPVVRVVGKSAEQSLGPPYLTENEQPFTHKGILSFASGPFGGLKSDEAIIELCKSLVTKSPESNARITQNWRLRDWLISRQRYWGCPIPIVHCYSCGTVPVPEKELPVTLPKLQPSQLLGKGGNPLEHIPEWLHTNCPKCHGPAKRETDTMDTFMDSSWYFFRYLNPELDSAPFSTESAEAVMPVDVYVGGVEHAILHLLYARFISKFLATTSLWPSGGGVENKGEPFKRLVSQGMVHGRTYSDPDTGRFLKPTEVDLSDPNVPVAVDTGKTAKVSFEKMSKSKHNGVDPGQCIAEYGADATRAHMLFAAPVSEILEWHQDRIIGIQRWFSRVWRISEPTKIKLNDNAEVVAEPPDTMTTSDGELCLLMHQTISSVSDSLEKDFTLNTLVSDLIKLTNALASSIGPNDTISPSLRYLATSNLLRMLAPVAPAFSEECWERLHQGTSAQPSSILDQPFPIADANTIKILSRSQKCSVQTNGKLRFVLTIPVPSKGLLLKENAESLQDWVLASILESEQGHSYFGDGGKIDLNNDVKKIIVVKGGTTVNFVVNKQKKEA